MHNRFKLIWIYPSKGKDCLKKYILCPWAVLETEVSMQFKQDSHLLCSSFPCEAFWKTRNRFFQQFWNKTEVEDGLQESHNALQLQADIHSLEPNCKRSEVKKSKIKWNVLHTDTTRVSTNFRNCSRGYKRVFILWY